MVADFSKSIAFKGSTMMQTNVLLSFMLVFSAGCASMTSKLPGTKTLTESQHDAPAPVESPPLVSPSGQDLAIALETARLAEQRGMDQEAIEAYLAVRQHQQDYPGVAHSLAVLYDRSGRVDDAGVEYRRAISGQPANAALHCDHGYFQYGSGRLDEAEKSYRKALQLEPKHHQSQVNLAVVLAHQGDYDQATKLFTEAIGPAAAQHNVGMIKLQRGEHDAAKAMLAKAAALDPSVARRSTVVLASIEQSARPTVGLAGGVEPAGFLQNEASATTIDAH